MGRGLGGKRFRAPREVHHRHRPNGALALGDVPLIRPPTDAEWDSFVRETACKVRWPHRYDERTGRLRPVLPWSEWQGAHGAQLDAWREAGEVLVYEAKGVVLGFLISTGLSLRCLYVKREFRGHRIGLQLVTARWPEFVQLVAYRPTPSFLRWASLHGIPWTHLDSDRVAA